MVDRGNFVTSPIGSHGTGNYTGPFFHHRCATWPLSQFLSVPNRGGKGGIGVDGVTVLIYFLVFFNFPKRRTRGSCRKCSRVSAIQQSLSAFPLVRISI